jgi:hypothetical protein
VVVDAKVVVAEPVALAALRVAAAQPVVAVAAVAVALAARRNGQPRARSNFDRSVRT